MDEKNNEKSFSDKSSIKKRTDLKLILGIIILIIIIIFIYFQHNYYLQKSKTTIKTSSKILTPLEALKIKGVPVNNPNPNATPSPVLSPEEALKIKTDPVVNPNPNVSSSPVLSPEEAIKKYPK